MRTALLKKTLPGKMLAASSQLWPKDPDHCTWPPGGKLEWCKPKVDVPLCMGGTAPATAAPAVSASAVSAPVATITVPPVPVLTLPEYLAAHAIEEHLNTALNKVAREVPTSPWSTLAGSLPADIAVPAAATVPPLTAAAAFQQISNEWAAMRSWNSANAGRVC